MSTIQEQTSRVVVITGGGTGVGYACAERFAKNGDRVVIMGRRESVLKEAAGQIGDTVDYQSADVSQRDQVEGAVENIANQYGQIDVLINNAGFVLGTLASMDIEEVEQAWDSVIDTNLKGSFLMAVAVSKHLPSPGGRIINISSIAAFTGGSRAGAIAYAAAKSGMHGMTYSLARELSPQGMTVNAIAPGFIAETEFTGGWPDSRIQEIVSETPAGRPGQASDIADAAFYLASQEASFVTGEILNVNGGWLFGR
jgi:3-oxoacyl-[acyl-carrier protein] reductase